MTVVVMGLMLTSVGRVWSTTAQREREEQLLFVGHEFRSAIGGYFAQRGRYPETLQDLLGGSDSSLPKRYLRRIYFDPMTRAADWQLIAGPGGGIMGVASMSRLAPIKRTNFDLADAGFTDATCYCEWQFVYVPRRLHRPAHSITQQ
jgi:type II secretory pathway pseudopilin PulG